MSLNKLLEKQIKKYLKTDSLKDPQMELFIKAVNNSYNAYEKDQSLSSHAFKLSEQEYAAINDQLKDEIEIKRQGIKNLKEAINNIKDNHEQTTSIDVNEDNLLDTFAYLNEQINKRKLVEQELKNSEYRLSTAANRLSQLISNLHNGILLEDENRNIVLTNQLFCNLFEIPAFPEEMKGLNCENPAEQSRHLFKNSDDFITRIDEILKNKKLVIGDKLEMKNGKILLRDYVPVFISDEYKGHLWKYADVTVEKEKEEQLKVLSLIAEDNINAVIISDAAGKITWVNKSFVKITGYTLDEVIGKKPAMMQGADTNPETIAYLKEQIFTGSPFNCDIINYTKNGEAYWVRIQGQAIKNSQGEITGYFAMEQDITREKEDQDKLKEYESRFRRAFEKIGDNVWEHDFGTGKTYFSNTKSHLLGYDFEEFSDNANLWWDRTYDDDKLLLEQNDARYRHGEIDHHILEYRVVHKDGSIRWVMDRGMVIEITKDGRPSKIIGTHTDITERKLAEELLQREEKKYRSIIANMNLGLLEVDTDENVVFTNQIFCEMSGYEHDELVGKKASHIYKKEENIELIESKNEARRRGSMEAYEIAVKNKRGQLRWWLISGAPRYNEAGKLVGSIGIHLDITDQKQLEIDLIDARELAEESTRSKEIFLANMSHEIRTPMNAIIGMANQLTKTKLDSKQLFYLDTINSASENLLVIINDILDLSKIEAGKLNLERIGFEPKAVISRAMQVLMHRAEEKGLSITNLHSDTALSPVLIGDPYRLNQVLLNLMSNAIKFTVKGSVDLSCFVVRDTASLQTIHVKVQDTGIGMDELFVKNLFEKFSQEDVSVTRQYGGTGLGMSICKDLIELMGGEIKVESKKGEGTTVSFKVSFAKGNKKDLPFKEILSVNKDMLKDKRILIVDDNNMNRLVAKTILDNYGAITSEAVNGKEAVEMLQINKPDLVLMDIQMPVMGGMEATKIIRGELSKSLPIIALTANAIKGDNEKYIEGGMNAYLSKPFREQDLLQIVSFWVGGFKDSADKNLTIKALPVNLYDLSDLRAISRGNELFVVKMVNLFIKQTPENVAEMENKYRQGDFRGMAAIAHKIKPSIDNMGIVSLKEAIREIEKIGKSDLADERLEEMIPTVTKKISQVIESLQKEFEEVVC